jgi:hypothetical protein
LSVTLRLCLFPSSGFLGGRSFAAFYAEADATMLLLMSAFGGCRVFIADLIEQLVVLAQLRHEFAKRLPAGSFGTAAIYTDHMKPTHIVRRDPASARNSQLLQSVPILRNAVFDKNVAFVVNDPDESKSLGSPRQMVALGSP